MPQFYATLVAYEYLYCITLLCSLRSLLGKDITVLHSTRYFVHE